MSTSQRSSAPPRIPVDASSSRQYEIYNIIPLDNMLADHPALRFPEVRAAVTALRTIGDLRPPPFVRWSPSYDLLDWLGLFFGFQKDNVKNQREHLVLLLANSQMRLQPPPDIIDKLEPGIVRKLRKKILRNYETWCSFLGCKSNVWISERRRSESDERKELLYICLFLLIWGESANLRFMPECLCYIFHHMAMELNKILEGYVDESTGQHCLPSHTGENAFLIHVVTPLYKTVQAEADASGGGKAPHSAWRNYDDINEYFWSNRCFKHLGWPMRRDSNFFVQPKKEETTMQKLRGLMQKQKVGKTGFVEQRTFWNLFHSFDRLWILLILFLQAAIIVAWEDRGAPWDVLKRKDAQVKMLSLFITWAGLRLWQALLDAGMEFNLVSRETPLQGFRMLLKILTAAVWSILFTVLYVRTWNQRNHDFRWSPEADRRLKNCLWAAAIFVLPECLALVLFIVPWIRNFVEKSSLKIFHLLTWWFQSRSYVGRGLREGLVDNLLYSLFWVLLLAVKFAFSYQFQIKPMVEPTKEILKVKHIKYRWHEFFKNTNHLAVGLIWAPVILIYFMDTQIWYSIMSSIIGALVGLFDHLGEIRNIQQFRLRFQMFASAIQFNLMPEEPLFRQSDSLNVRIRDAWKRFRLRYGFGTAFKKMESNHPEAGRFGLIWNEIIKTFREEDIVNNREVELLEMPLNSWNIRVIQWPCLLLSNELLLSLSQARTLAEYSDRRLWRKISKYEYRRCAVIETYDSVKHLLLRIVREDSEERTVIQAVFDDIESAIKLEKFTEKFKMSALPEVYSKVIALVEAIKRKPSSKELQKVVNALQNLYEIFIRDFTKEKRDVEQLRRDGLVSLSGGTTLLFGDAVDLPDADDEGFYRQLRRLHTVLTSRESMNNVPKNLEARRRIAFFSNSLFMNMPHAPQVEKMMTFSVLTPYYDEDVMYSKEQLRTENEDGVSIIFYLQKIFNDEWENFRERMAQKGVAKESELWGTHIRELRLWASYRGQTLARTVRGMMYYHKALKLLAFLDSASEMDLREGFRELVATVSGQRAEAIDLNSSSFRSAGSVGSVSGGAGFSYQDHELATAMLKFTYVVACQIYGTQRSKKDPRAEDILYLMKNNEALRVAYVDQVNAGRDNAGEDVWEYYSVLVKYDPDLRREVEIYRVKLPGPLKLGEGKPENQNHAMIFTRGDAVQTIDMNQDNYFEEALKMRNLLQEFTKYYGIRKPTILGVREHVFTGSVSSLAWFMSAQEMSFVTLGQRVLATPLKVRMHYGHPDVFDRLWFISRGGISKASRVINISEDIFAGFNCTLRGGNVTHHEYIQVGKGRDVGLNQISMFEAKVASGNGEQVLSRDVYRLGHRLDFFRMLSFFYTTVGFYFNTMMIVLTVYAFLWGRVYLALSGVEESINSSSTDNKALGAILNQQFIVQLGLFTALPMIIENSLERGFLSAVWDFLTMQLQLASVFYTFSMGTRTHYFGRTILHGGAKYRATGRGFVVQHKKFAENYRLYARSHFVKAIELGILLIVYASYNASSSSTLVYILLTISSWFLVFSWIMAPFLFNPSGFDWLKTVYDYDDFMNWIWYRGGIFTKSEHSWEAWWNEENDHLRSSGLWAIVVEILLDLRFFFFQYGIVYQLGIANGSTSIFVYLLSWIYVIAAFAIYIVISSAHDKYAAKQHIYYRAIQSLVISVVILAMVILFQFAHLRITDLITSLLAFVPTGWGLISIVQVFKPFLQHRTVVWHSVVSVARLYEIMLGMIIMMPMAILSWLPGFQSMQTRILFNEAFSRGLQISRILAGKKANPNI